MYKVVVVEGGYVDKVSGGPAISPLGRFEQIPSDYRENKSLGFLCRPPQI